ncbi:very short patch repair endonuclease [Asticcacaulis taihuensis]|uniref:very short patch repair endonuclease n=1 Tax=Asticcacaulis taihuensis TaxID=260084 RepID=UPI0026E98CE0|nr:DNA mismatch endonuclease Vsr [Asticcacaulis taihuensis]
MPDVHDSLTRSRNMAAIKGKDTRPELMIRKALHRLGFRFRLHSKDLPGKPDLVLPKYKAVIFINGCFWHHHNCHLFKWPLTREEFWRTKINRNTENDARNTIRLEQAGWRIATVWECALKGRTKISEGTAIQLLAEWLRSDENTLIIRGMT